MEVTSEVSIIIFLLLLEEKGMLEAPKDEITNRFTGILVLNSVLV